MGFLEDVLKPGFAGAITAKDTSRGVLKRISSNMSKDINGQKFMNFFLINVIVIFGGNAAEIWNKTKILEEITKITMFNIYSWKNTKK